jgi:hypothetical protein
MLKQRDPEIYFLGTKSFSVVVKTERSITNFQFLEVQEGAINVK